MYNYFYIIIIKNNTSAKNERRCERSRQCLVFEKYIPNVFLQNKLLKYKI